MITELYLSQSLRNVTRSSLEVMEIRNKQNLSIYRKLEAWVRNGELRVLGKNYVTLPRGDRNILIKRKEKGSKPPHQVSTPECEWSVSSRKSKQLQDIFLKCSLQVRVLRNCLVLCIDSFSHKTFKRSLTFQG